MSPATDRLTGISTTKTQQPSTGGARQASDPAAIPVAAAPASARPRGASAGTPSPVRAPRPAGEGTTSSPQLSRERAAAGMPRPATGEADPAAGNRLPASPGRARVQAPAGGALASPREATSVLPAGQAAIAAAMSEDRGPDSLEAHLRRLMKGLGLTGFHVEKSLDVEKNRKNVSVKGWPDWTIRGPRGVLFRELKSQRGKVKPEQQAWLDDLKAAGCDAGVWRPGCLLSGRIARELAAISGLRTAGGAA